MGKIYALRTLRATYLGSMLVGMLLLVMGSVLQPVAAQASQLSQSSGRVDVAEFKLPITPISAQYFDRVIQNAENDGAAAVVFQIDTPGGLVDSMQEMVKRTLASKIPVIAYVSPSGAQAASAGIFLVYSAHIAAMAPTTNLGSASVLINGGNDQGGGTPESVDQATLRRKVTEDLVTQIRGLATLRGRNPDFGEQAIRVSKNIGSSEALKTHVIDVMPSSVPDLLNQIDGRKVEVN